MIVNDQVSPAVGVARPVSFVSLKLKLFFRCPTSSVAGVQRTLVADQFISKPGTESMGTAAMIPLALELVGIPAGINVLEIKYVLFLLSAATAVPNLACFATVEVTAVAGKPRILPMVSTWSKRAVSPAVRIVCNYRKACRPLST